MLANPDQSFSVTYDSFSKFLSAGVGIALLAAAIAIRSEALVGLLVLLMGLSYAYSPRGYVLADAELVIKRLIGDVRIPLGDIREVRGADPDDLKGCLRLFGNGGLFGYYGIFRTSQLGKCNWYVTNRANAVVLITGEKTLILSPDDVNRFVAAVRMYLSRGSDGSAASVSSSTRAGRGSGRLAKWLAIAIGVLAVLFAVGAFLYAPGPPKYTLTSEGLAIHDRFYPVTLKAAGIDVESIRIVNIGTDKDWRPTMRTNGFANTRYRAGWFKVACGKKVRMYRADGQILVLLPPRGDGTPVLMEVDQPEAFIKRAQQLWR